MRVWYIRNVDVADWGDPSKYVRSGTLTTDHPTSSYEQPVIVDEEDGAVYGPGDIYEGGWAGDPGSLKNPDVEEVATFAGYHRERNSGETDTTY